MTSFFDCVQSAMDEGSLPKGLGKKAQRRWQDAARALAEEGFDNATAMREAAEAVQRRLLDERLAQKKHHASLARWQQQARMEVMAADRVDLTDQMTRVDMEARGLVRKFTGQMADAFERIKPDLLSRNGDPAFTDDVVRASFGESAPGDAQAASEVINSVLEDMRQMANAAGASIGKLDIFGWATSHNRDAILEAGLGESLQGRSWLERKMARLRTTVNAQARDALEQRAFNVWFSEIAPELEWTRILDPYTKRPMQTGSSLPPLPAQERYMRAVFDNIVFGRNAENPVYGVPQGEASWRRLSHHRVLHFKSADAWLRYNKKYGSGDPIRALHDHINGMAKDIAMMRAFSPTPTMGLTFKANLFRASAATRQSTSLLRTVDFQEKHARQMMRVMSGQGLPKGAVAEWAATFFANTRQVVNGSLLERAVLAAPPDLANIRMAAEIMGRNPDSAIARFVGMMPSLSKDELKQIQYVAETWTNPGTTQARWSNEVGASNWAQAFNNFSMRVQGLSAWTDRARGIAYQEFAAGLAAQRGKAFNELPDLMQAHFRNYNITPDDWARFTADDAVFRAENGAEFLAPSWWRAGTSMPEQQAEDLFRKMVGAQEHYLELSVPTRSLYMDAFIDPVAYGMTPGSLGFEILKSGGMFKRFVLSMTRNVAYQATLRPTPMSRWGYVAVHVAYGAMFGALAIQAKELIAGRDPQDMTDPGFWWRSTLAGGGLAIVGDLAATGTTSWGGGFAGYAMGPIAQGAWDASRLTLGNGAEAAKQFLAGEPIDTNLVPEARRFIDRYLVPEPPFVGPAVDRMIGDSFVQFLDPDALREMERAERARQNRSGNASWWMPGQALPSRAPDFGAAFGG